MKLNVAIKKVLVSGQEGRIRRASLPEYEYIIPAEPSSTIDRAYGGCDASAAVFSVEDILADDWQVLIQVWE